MNPLVLFLDFDGVVHPEPSPEKHTFKRLPLIEEVLREFETVEMVISSAWRLDYGSEEQAIEDLKGKFSLDLQPRVVGVTPTLPAFDRLDLANGLYLFQREAECRAWLRKNRPAWTEWVALDDRDYLFRPFSPNLIAIDGRLGFRRMDQDRLRQVLEVKLGGKP